MGWGARGGREHVVVGHVAVGARGGGDDVVVGSTCWWGARGGRSTWSWGSPGGGELVGLVCLCR